LALGHPEKVTDFGYRAIHVMTEIAKQVVQARFANAPRFSYFLGCSNGGRQALMEASAIPPTTTASWPAPRQLLDPSSF